ncbi:MAG: PorT family protein [Bacteroidales bacterium]|nr:MAG: PorT family protein [Bacteroidales bacterium]
MKKILFLVGLFLVNLTIVKAQQQTRRFSIFADPQLSWFTSDTKKFKSDGAVMGFNIGFNADKYFAERYAIFTGLSINNLGGNLKYVEDGYKLETRDSTYNIDAGTTIKLKAQYLSVPLGLKFKTNEIGYLTFTAQVGVSGHIRLKGAAWDETHNIDKETATKQFNLLFASYHVGAGAEYSLGGSSSIQAGIIYSSGIFSAYDAGYGKVSLGSLALRIGVVF